LIALSTPSGYHSRYLRIGPGPDGARLVPVDDSVLRRYLGGVGLGAWVLARETPAGVDPLGPEAALVFALSPLVGSPLTTSAKFAVVAIGPLTGRLCDALCSSHFALAAKRVGVDAICVTGRWPGPVALAVDGLGRVEPGVEAHDATDLWGLPAAEAERRLRARLGHDWHVSAIGPAGEACIPFATISHDGRHAGRGGLGAVLGSKRVKALAVRGDHRTPLADPQRTSRLARDLSARSLGPATEKYRELGTVANLLVFNRLDALPARNFSEGHFAEAERLAAVDLAPARKLARNSCAACTIGCEHIYELGGRRAGVRLEYESLFALGPLCGVSDPDAVLRASALCDDCGLDTISAGGTIAFLMDAAEQGWIDDRLPSGRRLRFGDGEAVVELLSLVVERRGLGAFGALGSRRAAEVIGGDAPEVAMHVKGLELPGYHPRALHAMALGLAVGTRGADHNRSSAYDVDFSGRADRRCGGPDTVPHVIEAEDRAALLDSLILCKFLRGALTEFHAEAGAMLSAVTGWDVETDELHATARRIIDLRRAINQREGWTRAEDTLPARLLVESPAEGLSRTRLEAMIEEYYQRRGWGADGRLPPGRMAALLGCADWCLP
jgi:aldehyde:ferredoxin oxidoreductase